MYIILKTYIPACVVTLLYLCTDITGGEVKGSHREKEGGGLSGIPLGTEPLHGYQSRRWEDGCLHREYHTLEISVVSLEPLAPGTGGRRDRGSRNVTKNKS